MPDVAASTQDQLKLLLTSFLGKNTQREKAGPRAFRRPAGAESGGPEPCPGQRALSALPSPRAGAACVGSGVVPQPHTADTGSGALLFLEAAPVLSWAAFVASGQVWA